MFTDIILDYYRNPKNKGHIANADAHARDVNPLCGDTIEMSLKVNNGTITEAKFDGTGCAISQAAASMLTELIEGKPLSEVKNITKDEVLKLLNIPVSPVRLKCALLGLKVLKLAAYPKLEEAYDD